MDSEAAREQKKHYQVGMLPVSDSLMQYDTGTEAGIFMPPQDISGLFLANTQCSALCNCVRNGGYRYVIGVHTNVSVVACLDQSTEYIG